MLKTRLIPVLNIMNGLIVRSEEFGIHQVIGNVVNEAQRYNEWNVDELIYLDITRQGQHTLGRSDHHVADYSGIADVIERVGKVCFMPLTFGGGVRTLDEMHMRFKLGADKVTINGAAFEHPELLECAARRFGSQAIVSSIDYRIVDGDPIVFRDFGATSTGIEVNDWVRECTARGAGEIFLNAIDRDGRACGYDLDTVASVVAVSKVPVVACGGAGDFHDFIEVARETGVSGVAAGNIFHFTENSYPRAKKLMKTEGINVRT